MLGLYVCNNNRFLHLFPVFPKMNKTGEKDWKIRKVRSWWPGDTHPHDQSLQHFHTHNPQELERRDWSRHLSPPDRQA